MQIRITEHGTAEVAEVDNITALDVAADGHSPEAIDAALRASKIGRLEGEHAWLGIEALQRAAYGDDEDGDAVTDYKAMIAYARGKGWVNDNEEVRAHLA